jgi:hypothetical protein
MVAINLSTVYIQTIILLYSLHHPWLHMIDEELTAKIEALSNEKIKLKKYWTEENTPSPLCLNYDYHFDQN